MPSKSCVLLRLRLLGCVAFGHVVIAQVNPYQAAREADQKENYAKAEALYSEAIDANLRVEDSLYHRGEDRYWLKNYSGAKSDMFRLRNSKVYGSGSFLMIGVCEGKLGHPAARLAAFREGLRLLPTLPEFANSVAWDFATSRDAATRNGREAVRLARRACAATSFHNAGYFDTLAAAYAEVGDFPNAIKSEQQALALFSSQDREHLPGAKKRLALYENKQAYRQDLHGND